jgi:DDE superfamily endonuclease
MSAPPARFAPCIVAFSGLFRQRTWRHARALLLGAILAPGVRTVASVLRILGLARERRFCRYHRVLSRAVWSPRAASRILLRLLLRAFVPAGPLVFGVDDTIERRRGKRIRAKGIYRDPVHSSHSHFVKASGLRWLSVMLLAPVPWAGRVWALPVLTALAPSERAEREAGRRHKRLTDWARQLLRQTGRWCGALAPGRRVVMVADMSFAALELLAALAPAMTCITRLRFDARLFTPAPPRRPGTNGRPRIKGERLPLLATRLSDATTRWQRVTVAGWYGERARDVELATGTAVWHHPGLPILPIRWVLVRDPFARFDPQALLSTDLALSAGEIVGYFVRRWQVEVTFEEARRHLGLETQRQWSDRAIARATPVLLGLFSVVTLLAARLVRDGRLPVRTAAWYAKRAPTFSDALAAVRAHWWRRQRFRISTCEADMIKLPRRVLRRLSEAACYAA